jgi:flagellar biosynthetic protein FliO
VASTSTFELLIRLALSLAVVIGLMVGATALLKRRGFAGFAGSGPRRPVPSAQVEVLARKPLGRNASVAIVRAGGKSMVLGVTDAQVTLLVDAEIDELELDEVEAQGTGFPRAVNGATSPWKTMLESLRDRTVRRT